MRTLSSYLSGHWTAGASPFSTLVNPATGEPIAQCSTEGLHLAGAVQHARSHGGPALRAMTFAQRGAMLAQVAKALSDEREALIALAIENGGNTRSDAKFDLDGAAVTLSHYAELGAKLGDTQVLPDGDGVPLGRGARLYGQHVLTTRPGVALHINAFNFPAWGMAEKAGVAWLAGMPVISKPATATALVAFRVAELWVASGALPPGAFTFIAGGPGELVSTLGAHDVLSFTGSSYTAYGLRRSENLARESVHVNVEADSLNSAVLGPDVAMGSETANLFLTDVVREVTQKAGQKCTAIRRVYVPAARLEETRQALVDRLKEVRVGNPADEKTQMGPLATAQQLADVRAGIERLNAVYEMACGEKLPRSGPGFFVAPTLFVNRHPKADGDVVNAHEVFGPVVTLMPYQDLSELGAFVEAGGGGLVSSLYSDDRTWTGGAVARLAALYGRLTISSEKVAGVTVSPGTVMPMLLHGGPGRAGGGEELGGLRGLSLYMQRCALQGPRAFIESWAGTKPSDSSAAAAAGVSSSSPAP